MLIRRAEVAGETRDVRLAAGRVEEIGASLAAASGEATLDAAGGALLPGLHDHHLHLLALAAAEHSVRCGPPQVGDPGALAAALRNARVDDAGWVRGVGYHESVAGPLDRARLDAWAPDRPLRIQHRSGALWSVNSAGAERLGLDAEPTATPGGVERDASGRATGRLFRADAWLRDRLGSKGTPSLIGIGRRLASCGVTGVTDATPGNDAAELHLLGTAIESGALPQRLVVMGTLGLPAPAVSDRRLSRGAVKLVIDERDLPDYDALRGCIAAAHARERTVAIHCVTRAELFLALGALREAGAVPGDRIEHASVAPPEAVALLAELPVTVVTQPHFIRERGDAYAFDVDVADRPWLYRCRGFLEASVPLGGGTDAPFGEPDPWRAMQAAVDRRSAGGRTLGSEEALDPEEALALFTSPAEAPGDPPRAVTPGAVADLCLLDRPWGRARDTLSSGCVAATFREGVPIWHAGDGA